MTGNTTVELESLVFKEENKKRTAFYPSDTLKPSWELYQSWIGTEKTNPPKWFETLKWGAGNGVEASMLKVLKDSGIVDKQYDQNIHGLVNHEKFGFPLHGRIDAITVDGFPIEIKSINNKNIWDIKGYENGFPRESI